MGRDRVSVTFTALVSRHNSEQDDIDDALWEKFVERVEAIARESEFEQISLWST